LRRIRCAFLPALALGSAFGQSPEALPLVSPIFADKMVMQRGKPNAVWGWSTPGDRVRVEAGRHSAVAVAAADGKWQMWFEPPPAGGPYTMKVTGGTRSVELRDVLVGDVWIAAGQSNMQFGLAQARDGAEEIRNANHPQMRYFVTGQRGSYSKASVPRGSWREVLPQNLAVRGGGISAIGYFFARKLQENVKVPIGLVQIAVGGVPAETFTSAEGLSSLRDFDEAVAEVERRRKKGEPEYGYYLAHWYDDYDIGSKGQSWADPALSEEQSWKPVRVPGGFGELGGGASQGPSLIWLRKEITLPEKLPEGRARLHLGNVDKMDTTFVNGRQIGASSWVENPRAYFVPDGVLKPGRNVIAIRLFLLRPDSGFLNKPEVLRLTLGDGTTEIPLAGEWKGRVAVDARPPHRMPFGVENNPTMAGILYNGMLAPIAPLAITGAIWYQGESNAERAYQYRQLLPAMIADWRRTFGQGDFPFYIVGLPYYKARKDVPSDDSWAEMRESQAMIAERTPNSCLAVTIDTGNAGDVHPIDKKDAGDRLALCALANHYGQKIPFRGPMVSSVERVQGAMKIRFRHTDGGLAVKGERLGEFAIAGADRKWYWADEARIEGDSIVVVSSAAVPNPVAVRYAWQANPMATLFNGAGLPAAPFRTDDWPGVTFGRTQHPDLERWKPR